MTDAQEKWILSFSTGSAWYCKLNSEQSKRTYLPNFKRYCDWAKKNPDELIKLKVEGLQNINTEKEFQAENLLEKFLTATTHKPNVKKNIRTATLSFYKANRRNLVNVMDVETPEAKKRCPKTQDIVDLDNAFVSLRDKAMLWFIASAPFRVDTLTLLRWEDLKPTGDGEVPYFLVIGAERLKGHGKGKYKGLKQIAFLHGLATKKLEGYKKELERKGYIPTEISPIFIPYRKETKITKMSTFSVERNFDEALLRAWHDLEKKRFSPHDFRDYVQSACESAGIHANMIAPLLAHKVKGADFHYSDHDVQELLEKFKTALPYLLPQSIERVKAESEKELSQQQHKIVDLEHKLIALTETVEKLYPKQLERHILNEKGKIERRIENNSSPEEYLENERRFMREVLLHGKSKVYRRRLKDAIFILDKNGIMPEEAVRAEVERLRQRGLK